MVPSLRLHPSPRSYRLPCLGTRSVQEKPVADHGEVAKLRALRAMLTNPDAADSQPTESRAAPRLPTRFYATLSYTRRWGVGRPRELAIVRLKRSTPFGSVRAEFARQHATTLRSGTLDPSSFYLRAATEDGGVVELEDGDTPEGVRLAVGSAQGEAELVDGTPLAKIEGSLRIDEGASDGEEEVPARAAKIRLVVRLESISKTYTMELSGEGPSHRPRLLLADPVGQPR